MSTLLRNSAWSLVAQGSKICTQAGLFILLARGFGVYEFGLYMAIFSISQLISPLAGLGTHNTLIMRVSRYPRILPRYFWTPVISTFGTGIILALAAFVFVQMIYKAAFWAVFSILLTEIVVYRLIDVVSNAWQALELLKKSSIIYFILSASRVSVASILFLYNELSMFSWSVFNFLLTTIVLLFYSLEFFNKTSVKLLGLKFYPREIKKGIYFSFSGISQAMSSNIDKVILSRLVSISEVGIYSTAFRVVQMGIMPLMAVLQATYPIYFREGKKGIDSSLKFSSRLSIPLISYGIFAAIGIYFFSPIITFLLGSEYQRAVSYIKALAIFPLLQVFQYLLGEAITGAGYQKLRALVNLAVGVSGILLNILFVSLIGGQGAVLTLLIGEAMLFLCYALIIFFLKKETS